MLLCLNSSWSSKSSAFQNCHHQQSHRSRSAVGTCLGEKCCAAFARLGVQKVRTTATIVVTIVAIVALIVTILVIRAPIVAIVAWSCAWNDVVPGVVTPPFPL